MPEPLDYLSHKPHAGVAAFDHGRWLALAIGQADKELPLILFAAVGRTSAFDLNTSGRS
jgi:hypothetical protein